ncbi:hypothetical protein PS15m_003379 [Mucor circinelloides]
MSDNLAHALSGAGGGIISMMITYPLVAISSRLQVQKNNSLRKDEHYKNTVDAFVKIINREGPKGLYSGFASGIFGIAVTNGVYYYCYEAVKKLVTKQDQGPITTTQSIISGSLAGIAVVIATHPIWTVNTRMSVQRRTLSSKNKRPTTLQVFLYILKKEGIVGLYSGCKAAMILVMNPIIQYAIFENLKARMMASKGGLSGSDYFLLGALSKLCATIIMYPYILIKSRLQMSDNTKERNLGVLENMRLVIKNEGIAGLYSGLNSKLLQSVLSSAFLFYAKEVLFDWSVWILVVLRARKSMQ